MQWKCWRHIKRKSIMDDFKDAKCRLQTTPVTRSCRITGKWVFSRHGLYFLNFRYKLINDQTVRRMLPMKTKTRLTLILIALALLFGVTACAGGNRANLKRIKSNKEWEKRENGEAGNGSIKKRRTVHGIRHTVS